MATVRYLVPDLDAAVAFYTAIPGFTVQQRYGPAMAILSRDDLTLWLAGPPSSAARPMPDGRVPEAGGWNRFVIEVDDLDIVANQLREAGVTLRSDLISGPGGRQLLAEDPAGNPIEFFEPQPLR